MGVCERLRLSSMAFLNSADWATIFAVVLVKVFGLLVGCSVVYLVGKCCREELNSGMPDDVICTPPSRYSCSWDLDRGVDHLHKK